MSLYFYDKERGHKAGIRSLAGLLLLRRHWAVWVQRPLLPVRARKGTSFLSDAPAERRMAWHAPRLRGWRAPRSWRISDRPSPIAVDQSCGAKEYQS